MNKKIFSIACNFSISSMTYKVKGHCRKYNSVIFQKTFELLLVYHVNLCLISVQRHIVTFTVSLKQAGLFLNLVQILVATA